MKKDKTARLSGRKILKKKGQILKFFSILNNT